MAITQNTFTGNGSNLGPFSLTFKWLEPTDIKVSVGGVLKTAGTHYNLQNLNYTTKTGGEVLFTGGNAPANGEAIRVFRGTDDSSLSATFNSGSAIRAQDLNDNFTQNLYITQEVNNNAVQIDGSQTMVGDLDIGGYNVVNSAAPSSGSDLANKTYVDDRVSSAVLSGNPYFLQDGAGAVNRSWASKLKDIVSVKDFGAVGDGVADDRAAIQAAIDSLGPFSPNNTRGGAVYIPAGTYLVSASINLLLKHGVSVIGDGELATEVKASGDYPVFDVEGVGITVADMTIRGGGSGLSSAHGLRLTSCNSGIVQNLNVYNCKHGLSIWRAWQLHVSNIDMHGTSCDYGIYMGESPSVNAKNNAVVASNLHIKDCLTCGIRIINGQGSKFVNCEASATVIGWDIGSPTTGTVLCQWLHFSNCLGDGCSSYCWRIRKGNATEIGEMQFSNCWAGNCTGGPHVYFEDASKIVCNNWQMVKAWTHNLHLKGCDQIQFTDTQFLRHNTSNTTKQSICVEDSTSCIISGVTEADTGQGFTDDAFVELGTSDNNVFHISGGTTGVLLGAASRAHTLGGTAGGAATFEAELRPTGDNKTLLRYNNNTHDWETGMRANANSNYYFWNYDGDAKFLMSSSVFFPATTLAGSLGATNNRWLNTYSSNFRPGDGTVIWTSGSGTPEGAVTAPVGSLFTRTDGGASTTLYVKQSGTGNTGWIAK